MSEENLGIPNLDDCPEDELLEASKTFRHLLKYCRLRTERDSLEAYPVSGRDRILELIKEMDTIYEMLPAWARW